MVIEQGYVRLVSPTGEVSMPKAYNDLGDKICIGIRVNGKYEQYDSYELWHINSWAEPLGIKVEYQMVAVRLEEPRWR